MFAITKLISISNSLNLIISNENFWYDFIDQQQEESLGSH